MSDTRQRAELFAVLRRMEADTVRMYEAATPRLDEKMQRPLRGLREGHESHVMTLEGLLGMCGPEDTEVPEDVRAAIQDQVDAVNAARDGNEALSRLLEAERTNAAEYAVVEAARLAEDERQALHRLHEEQRGYVRELETHVTR